MSDTEEKEKKQNPFSDGAAQAALDYLRYQAIHAATAKAHMVYMEHYVKIVLAQCTRDSQAKSVAAQEIEARCNQKYLDVVIALEQATKNWELHRWKMVAAEATIEAWRTHQANQRGEQRMQ